MVLIDRDGNGFRRVGGVVEMQPEPAQLVRAAGGHFSASALPVVVAAIVTDTLGELPSPAIVQAASLLLAKIFSLYHRSKG